MCKVFRQTNGLREEHKAFLVPTSRVGCRSQRWRAAEEALAECAIEYSVPFIANVYHQNLKLETDQQLS